MRITLRKRDERGIALFGAVVLMALFLILLAGVALLMLALIEYWLGNLPNGQPAPMPTQEQQAQFEADLTAQVQAEYEAQYPGQDVRVQAISMQWVPVFCPFGAALTNGVLTNAVSTNAAMTIVERSTNLVDWSEVARINPGEKYIDLDQLPHAFYRTYNELGEPAQDTNQPPVWYWVPGY